MMQLEYYYNRLVFAFVYCLVLLVCVKVLLYILYILSLFTRPYEY